MRRLKVFIDRYRIGISTVLIPVLFGVYIFKYDDKEFHIKLAGLILQLMGVYTVAYEIYQTRKHFEQLGILEKTAQFFKDFLELFKNGKKQVAAAGSANLGALIVSGRGHTEFKAKPDDSLERRIEILEEGLKDMSDRLVQSQKKYDKKIEKNSQLIMRESLLRTHGFDEVKLELKMLYTGGLHISSMGLAWLTLGIVMATIPEQIAKLL